MNKRISLSRLFCLALIAAFTFSIQSRAQTPTAAMATAAQNLMASLDEDQRETLIFDWSDEERFNFHFVPRDRLGLTYKMMQPEQQHLANALLATGMSSEGYVKAVTIMSLEKILYELENQASHRDPANYYFSIFGTPDSEGTWGWRVEGHHLSLNFTIVEGEFFSATPSFYGTNPDVVLDGPRAGLRVLPVEHDLGFELVNSLDEEQKAKAVFSNRAPRDIITAADREARVLEPLGISMDDLNDTQTAMLKDLIHEHVFRIHGKFAELEWHRLMENPDFHFAWAGGTEARSGFYYRIQGPDFLIEYDNTQNGGNHAHDVWRDLKNDFGADLLKQHYDESHQRPVKKG